MARRTGPVRKEQTIGGKAPSKTVSSKGSTPRVPERTRRGNQPGIK